MECLSQVCQKDAQNGMESFLKSFSYVPDEKLTWQPTPTAKSALQIAAHVAVTARNFARFLTARSIKLDDLDAFLEENRTAEAAITSREEAIALFRHHTEHIIEVLGSYTSEDAQITVDSGQGWNMPITYLMKLPGIHAHCHMGQIDYLQTCWDYQQIYVG